MNSMFMLSNIKNIISGESYAKNVTNINKLFYKSRASTANMKFISTDKLLAKDQLSYNPSDGELYVKRAIVRTQKDADYLKKIEQKIEFIVE